MILDARGIWLQHERFAAFNARSVASESDGPEVCGMMTNARQPSLVAINRVMPWCESLEWSEAMSKVCGDCATLWPNFMTSYCRSIPSFGDL